MADLTNLCDPATVTLGGSEVGGGPPQLPLPPIVGRTTYTIEGECARGGWSRILRARDNRLDRSVALKEPLRSDVGTRWRFIREARLTAQLEHPAIIPVYEVARWSSGSPFYAMKLINGFTLARLLAATRNLQERVALLPYVVRVTEAVAFAHSRGIVHRDIKPSNVMIACAGDVTVIDWGLAMVMGQDLEQPPGPLRDGQVVGTPCYMAPEQARGETINERTDIYALGAIVYQLLTGAPPFSGSSASVLAQVASEPPVEVLAREPAAPPELAALVAQVMAPDPDRRPRSATELADALGEYCVRRSGFAPGAVNQPAAGAPDETSHQPRYRRRG